MKQIRFYIVLVVLPLSISTPSIAKNIFGGIQIGHMAPMEEVGERFNGGLCYEVDIGYWVKEEMVFNVGAFYTRLDGAGQKDETFKAYSFIAGPRYQFVFFERDFYSFAGAGAGYHIFKVRFEGEKKSKERKAFGLYPETGLGLYLNPAITAEIGIRYHFLFTSTVPDENGEPFYISSDYYAVMVRVGFSH